MIDSTRDEVSVHEVHVYRVLRTHAGEWLSNGDIHRRVADLVSARTVRWHTAQLHQLGLLDRVRHVHAHHFRLAAKPTDQALAYVERVREAADVLGVQLPTGP